MSSPVVWIIIPGISSVLLFIIRRWNNLMTVLGFVLAIVLTWSAWIIPIGETYRIGTLSLRIEDTLSILGRQFVITSEDGSALVLIYAGLAFWFGGSRLAHTRSNFVPVGMGIASLLTAAIAVEPFLYAALLIEMAVLVFVAVNLEPGKEIGRGILRFLTIQTLGLPFILFAGWLLTGVEASPDDLNLVRQASLILGFGFAFLLGIFPFHTWIPMLAEEVHPYLVAFVFYLLPIVITLFGLGFLDRYAWLRNQDSIIQIIQFAGILMTLAGGLWVLFQRHLGRIIGFVIVFETGLNLLLLSTNLTHSVDKSLMEILFVQLLPRGLSLGIWALSSVTLCASMGNWKEVLRFRSIHGMARKYPIASAGLVLSIFSLAGFPLLGGFPARMLLWNGLASTSLPLALLAIFGCGCILFIGIRTMAVLVTGIDESDWQVTEPWGVRIFLLLGILGLVLIGMLPQWFTPMMIEMTETFGNLSP